MRSENKNKKKKRNFSGKSVISVRKRKESGDFRCLKCDEDKGVKEGRKNK